MDLFVFSVAAIVSALPNPNPEFSGISIFIACLAETIPPNICFYKNPVPSTREIYMQKRQIVRLTSIVYFHWHGKL